MKEEKQVCECCGATISKSWRPLSPLLVRTLLKFRDGVFHKNENSIHLQNDISLTKSEYNNFPQLRYHALVAKCKKSDGSLKVGYWLLTKKGADFLNGKIKTPKKVLVFRNKIVQKSEEQVDVYQALKSKPYTLTIETIEFQNDFFQQYRLF